MSEKKFGRTEIVNIVYRVMYALPIALAVFAEVKAWLQMFFKSSAGAEIASETMAVGGIYAGTLLLSLVIGFLLSLIVTLSKWTKIATGGGIVVTYLVLMFVGINPERLTVGALLWLLPVLVADIIRDITKKENESNVVFLLPFLIVSFLMINFLPISDKPLDWSGVVSIYERIAENTREFWGRFDWAVVDYNSSEIGFDGDSELFKKLKSNSDLVMEVNRQYPDASAVYMTGKVFADFDGKHWEVHQAQEGEAEYSRMMDTIETVSAARQTYPNNIGSIYRVAKVEVSIKSIKTDYMLAPSKMVVGTRHSIAAAYEGDNIFFDDTKRYGDSYSVEYYLMNRNCEDLIKYHREITEETWKEISYSLKPNGVKAYTYEELLAYRQYNKEVYGKDPELSDACMELIYEIVAGADNDYDKLVKIEAWLASHVYTTDVDTRSYGIRSASDFMDYFLLEETSGYCTYYATAFVMMARAEGIPARFVQGYRIPSSRQNNIAVTSNMAHAWAEAYFEGVGWIRFEPTPGYSSVAVWGDPLKEPEYYDNQDADAEAMDEAAAEEEIVEEVPYYDEEKRKAEEERLKAEAKRKQQLIIIIVTSTFAGIVIIGGLLICIRLIVRAVAYKHLSESDKKIEQCMRCMLVLHSLGKRPGQGETLSEFADRVKAECAVDNMTFIDSYERVIYRGGSEVKLTALEENYAVLKKLLKGRKKAKARIRFFTGVIFDRKVLND